jgi:hypothetical protein
LLIVSVAVSNVVCERGHKTRVHMV